jgi:hypothetical protein
MKVAPALNHLRFAPCAKAGRLLINLPETAGLTGDDDFRPTPMSQMNLSSAKFAEGKFRCPMINPPRRKDAISAK